MRVFIVNSGYAGCNYVRLYLPAIHNGFPIDISNVEKLARVDKPDYERIKAEMDMADAVVFHRPEFKTYYDLLKQLKLKGKMVIVDNDDTFIIDDYHPLANFNASGMKKSVKKRADNVDKFIKEADLVTCSTEILKEEYLKLNPNVKVLPNCIDPDDWEEPLRNEGDKVRIGLVGSTAFEYDYEEIEGVLQKLSDRDDVQLFMFGLGDKKHRKENPIVSKIFKTEYDFWGSLDIESVPWCHVSKYPKALNDAKLDIMLIPRRDNYFNRCKSNVKFLEASMCEIPVVARVYGDGQSPYDCIKDGVTGVKIENPIDWECKINELIKYKEYRRVLGKNAKKYTLKNFNIKDKYHLWDDAYNKRYETFSKRQKTN